ncbi:MAG: hypothetical protein A3E91_00760 [Candidatus Moranbacteria bacterium RIFCSPHIGHO2_12_FULL_40_10]|nr:MAG: hypothetical protein A3E91_00760 [Candidatus Moranbacteria bacterium RIFCSPHIGHO2_12_FULL_40_10]
MFITNEDNIKKWSTVPHEELDDFGDGDFSRIQMLNPAIFQLLGNVKDKKILDVGCGNGYLSRMLAKKGAIVVGVEPGDSMYQYAIKREEKEKLGIQYLKKDLSHLIQFNEEFDVVVANMVFMDIPEYQIAIKNCISSLKRGGIIIYSLLHPCFPGFEKDWQGLKHVEVEDYFTESSIEAQYGHVFYRPLQNYINLTNDYGCVTVRIIEPQLSKEFSYYSAIRMAGT